MPKRYFQDTVHPIQENEKLSSCSDIANRPISRCRHLVSRFEQLRQKLCTARYYDPYQKEQQLEDSTAERPAKRHRSVVSAVVDNMVHGVLYGAAAAYEYLWVDKLGADIIKSKISKGPNPKMRGVGIDFNIDQSLDLFQKRQRNDQSYRDIFYKTQQQAAIKKKSSIDNCYFTFEKKVPLIDEDWGLIDRGNYKVDFPVSCLFNLLLLF
jgi:hypothetical protein